MKILVNITTYKRPNELKTLLQQLKKYDVDVQVWDDDPNGEQIKQVNYNKFCFNHGKFLLWLKFQKIFNKLKKTEYDYYIFLPDDVVLLDNFINETVNTWKSIQDEKKICLSLLVDKRLRRENWTGFFPNRR